MGAKIYQQPNWDVGDVAILRGTRGRKIGGLALAPWSEASDAIVKIDGAEYRITPASPIAFCFTADSDIVLECPSDHNVPSAAEPAALAVIAWVDCCSPPGAAIAHRAPKRIFKQSTAEDSAMDLQVWARYRKLITVTIQNAMNSETGTQTFTIQGRNNGQSTWSDIVAAVSVDDSGSWHYNIQSPHDLIRVLWNGKFGGEPPNTDVQEATIMMFDRGL